MNTRVPFKNAHLLNPHFLTPIYISESQGIPFLDSHAVDIVALPIKFDISPYHQRTLFSIFRSIYPHFTKETKSILSNQSRFLKEVFRLSNTYTLTGNRRKKRKNIHNPALIMKGTPLLIPVQISKASKQS